MLRLLNESPRSISSREQASLMITASSSSSARCCASASAVGCRGGQRRGGGGGRETRARVEELIVLEQVDRAAAGGREHVGERRELLAARLGEELVGGGVHHRLVLADADDGRGAHGDLDRRGTSVGVDVGGLIGDLDVDVDGLRRDDADLRDHRDDERLARAAVDLQIPPAAGEQDLARVHAAQERGDDDRREDEDGDDDAADDDQRRFDMMAP